MKRIMFFIVVLLLAASAVKSQDHWKIMLNNKVVLQSAKQEGSVTARLKTSLYKTSDKLTIIYVTSSADPAWQRTFYINDANDSTLLTLIMNKQSGSVSVKSSRVKDVINKKKSVSVYSLSTPKDPSLAARVRVARKLLAKIEWN